jgi:uncharacterized protein YbjT (DUF2867 family)
VIVLVTGGSGFLGTRFVRAAVAQGHDVRCVVRSEVAAATVRGCGGTPLPGDLDDAASLDAAFASAQADALVNIASLGFGHADTIVAAAQGAGIGRAVFVSTTAVATTLAAPTRLVRLAAERTVRESGLDWTIVRPTMIYGGADDRNIARLLQALRRLPVLPVPGGGRRLQQPVHVEDLADALLSAMTSPAAIGQTYDVAGPRALSFRQLLEDSSAAVGRRVRLVPVPLWPCVAALRIYERVARRPRLKAEQLERLSEDKAFDIGPAVRDLGYAPRGFRDGVAAEAAETGG